MIRYFLVLWFVYIWYIEDRKSIYSRKRVAYICHLLSWLGLLSSLSIQRNLRTCPAVRTSSICSLRRKSCPANSKPGTTTLWNYLANHFSHFKDVLPQMHPVTKKKLYTYFKLLTPFNNQLHPLPDLKTRPNNERLNPRFGLLSAISPPVLPAYLVRVDNDVPTPPLCQTYGVHRAALVTVESGQWALRCEEVEDWGAYGAGLGICIYVWVCNKVIGCW